MKKMTNKLTAILSILVFSLAMLSGNAFAAPGGLPGEAAARTAADANLQSQIDALQEKIDAMMPTSQVFEIGDHHAGGIVFYVTEDGKHGLIAALTDQSTDIQWYNGAVGKTGAVGHGIGAGVMNTTAIVAALSNDNFGGNFAARFAADYAVFEDGLTLCQDSTVETCYGDWYLPSKDELNLMYINLHLAGLGGYAYDLYWSSTEDETGNGFVWDQDFDGGNQHNDDSAFEANRVRAIRAF